jgi:hypothetical protein
LREIVAGDAAGVDFHAIGVDLFISREESRHNRKIIDATASDSYDLRGHVSPQSLK